MSAHICIDCRLIGGAGIGTYIKSVLPLLAVEKKYQLTLLGLPEHESFLKQFSQNVIPFRASIYSLAEQIAYQKIIPRCTLFWSPHFNVPVLPIRAKKRLTTIHDVYHLAFSSSLPWHQKIYARMAYNSAFFLSDSVLTDSEFSKQEIIKYGVVKPKNLIVIPCPFDYKPIKTHTDRHNFILAVGNVKAHKNLCRLVRAYAELKPSEPLYIVGHKEGLRTVDQQLFHDVENDSFLKHHVVFTGYVNDERLKEFYATAKLFVFPSLYEGFGYPPLEAMASGCPVLAAHRGAIPEVCQDAIEYVNPDSVPSIREGMRNLLKDSAKRGALSQRGLEHIEKKRKEKTKLLDVIDACCHCT